VVKENLLQRAKVLRQKSSDTEQVLWRHLRARILKGYKFRRQVLMEPYIVDFACMEAKVVVEADGGQHQGQVIYDARRTRRLQ
jgi:very-short-patch-repair endonuclease